MKVILLKELRGKGGEGDIVDVAPGFANNYLLRQGYAVLATKGNIKQLEQRRHNIEKREVARVTDAEALKAKLDSLTIKVNAQVGEEGVLFGSVTSQMIADALLAQEGIEIDRRRIELGKPIKVAGEHEVTVALYREIKAEVKVLVDDLEALAAEEAKKAEAAAKTEEAAEAEAPVEEAAAE